MTPEHGSPDPAVAVPLNPEPPRLGGLNSVPLVFDLEVLRTPAEVGGWGHIDRMGFGVGVVAPLKARDGEPFTFWPYDDLAVLQDLLNAAPFVVGWNHVAFDYVVMAGAGWVISQQRNVDLCLLTKRSPLSGIAERNLGHGKEYDSAKIPLLLRTPATRGIAAAECGRHVTLTRDLWHRAWWGGGLYVSKDRRDRSFVRISRGSLNPVAVAVPEP